MADLRIESPLSPGDIWTRLEPFESKGVYRSLFVTFWYSFSGGSLERMFVARDRRDPQRFRCWRIRSYLTNPLLPVLWARMEEFPAGTIITGDYGHWRLAPFVVATWAAMPCALLMVGVRDDPIFIALGVALALIMGAIGRMFHRLARLDREVLASELVAVIRPL